jgi:hypothetical protein
MPCELLRESVALAEQLAGGRQARNEGLPGRPGGADDGLGLVERAGHVREQLCGCAAHRRPRLAEQRALRECKLLALQLQGGAFEQRRKLDEFLRPRPASAPQVAGALEQLLEHPLAVPELRDSRLRLRPARGGLALERTLLEQPPVGVEIELDQVLADPLDGGPELPQRLVDLPERHLSGSSGRLEEPAWAQGARATCGRSEPRCRRRACARARR